VRRGEQPTGGRDRGDRDRPHCTTPNINTGFLHQMTLPPPGDRDRNGPSFSSHRPALNLQPSTLPVDAVAAPVASSKSNPFGEAQPISEEERERRFLIAKVS
jgi:hypothetical protein